MPLDSLADRLRAEAAAIDVALSDEQTDRLVRYLHLIQAWRARAGLTAVTDPLAAARVHVADSLLALRARIAGEASLIDVGSGAGLPGIPLAVVRPDLRVALLEADARKAAFLEVVIHELAISARVIHARAEQAGRAPAAREQFDAVTARAVAPLSTLLELTLPFAKIGGQTVLLKGPGVARELRSAARARALLGGGNAEVLEAHLAGGETRTLVIVPKIAATPAEYPRRAGVPKRKPLSTPGQGL